MRYLSVCSGIEAATVAWHPLGWEAAGYAEIEAFPSAVLAHHYPTVPNLGDMTKFKEWDIGPIDLLVGGTPCQSFSVAGLRKGLGDPRGNLMLTFGAIAAHLRPRWLVWENVPGVLSSHRGRDFGTFLGMLGELGYGFAYRVLDAQFFGVAQRRRRVFVIGHLGNWAPAAAVLFEPESLLWNPPPSRGAGKVSPTIPSRSLGGGGLGTDFDLDGECVVMSSGQANAEISTDHSPTLNCLHEAPIVAHSLRGEGFDASEDGTGRGIPLVVNARQDPDIETDLCPPMSRKDTGHALAFDWKMGAKARSIGLAEEQSPTLSVERLPAIQQGNMAVRRLTPRECERLQGFPDDYTQIPWRGKNAEDCPDGPRYKALGNSMAVPVMAWIGRRIAMVDSL